jgi:TonB family protein
MKTKSLSQLDDEIKIILMKHFIAAMLLLISANVFAQDTIYYDASTAVVNSRALAYSYEVKSFLKDNNDVVLLREYYTNGWKGRKSEKVYSSWKEKTLQGKETRWDTAGKVLSEIKHNDIKLNGEFFTYVQERVRSIDTYKGDSLNASAKVSEDAKDTTYIRCEEMPKFPGGEKNLFKFLRDNIKYPVLARENGIQGRVYITFIVEKDGTINGIEIIRGVDESLDEESLRVVRLMPPWSQGMQDGNPVRVRYNLPIAFVMK